MSVKKADSSQEQSGRPKGLTIADVAKAANVSLGTVSNVLNGTRTVSRDRHDRVMHAIEQLGYKPNVLAQQLRRSRNSVVGICVPHVANTYFMQLVDGLEKLSLADGWDTIHVYARRDVDHLKEKVDWLIKFKINGLIMLPSIDAHDMLEMIARSGVPTVIIDRPVDDPRFDQVVTDAAGAMEEIIAGLAARGHRSILFITASKEFLVTKLRSGGLTRALVKFPEMKAKVIEIEPSEEGLARQLASEFVSANPPTALVVGSGQIAARSFRALRRLETLIEQWPALVSFDQPEWADLSDPPISIVRPPGEAIAAKAWQLLTDRMQGFDGPPRHFLLSGDVELSAAHFIDRERPADRTTEPQGRSSPKG
jgi:DNA-binding LacI/PurR family transcriptional regulator